MLDEFAAVKVDTKKPAETPQTGSTQAKPDGKPAASAADPAASGPEEAFSEEDFAKQLQAGMADLLGELDKNVSPPPQVANDISCTDEITAENSLICRLSLRKCSSK